VQHSLREHDVLQILAALLPRLCCGGRAGIFGASAALIPFIPGRAQELPTVDHGAVVPGGAVVLKRRSALRSTHLASRQS
jgi:hypothetical protein